MTKIYAERRRVYFYSPPLSMICPVCLDPIANDEHAIYMPSCKHRLHTGCALNAAQYDARCPVCRHRDERVVERQRTDRDLFAQIEDYANRHNATVRRYRQRRNNALRQSNSMRRIRDNVRSIHRQLTENERILERAWVEAQRRIWKTNTVIGDLRKERQRIQRRYNYHNKRLEKRLADRIGDPPLSVDII